ncbi:histidine phosphatase family protein [Paenibacillus sp. GP183]|jgi:2,3-bisphosphoglycerate-dependent phosphoglycerate mutase|uniref:histidine phosphatase family protein n=1 Tax=Paenibacillus sp. GP183 TaxID=1882751 RepID=UPI00089A615A|nr:histidine phosphatase family protein [Paenibacillus sp. GP183]SEB63947.1 probable phosphoglycerate mutase [Paenibacillus sp. GP183]
MTTIGLIRHGSTEWNKLGKMQGQMDTSLTEEGRAQARLLGHRMKNEAWTGIFSSDLSRARETAEIISAISGIPILGFDARLRERSFGQVEGTKEQERIDRWGADWKKLDLGGETNEQVLARWHDFLEQLATNASDERLLLISHGGFIVQILRALSMEQDEFLQNTSLTILKRTDSSWELVLYNCLVHLES